MSDEAKTETPPPTKLIWYWSTQNHSEFIREHLASLPTLINHLGYGFTFSMPSVEVHVHKEERKTEKYLNWRGKERERLAPANPRFLSHEHFLAFNRELTEDELKFWRTIKLGYLARDFTPNGQWRNRD